MLLALALALHSFAASPAPPPAPEREASPPILDEPPPRPTRAATRAGNVVGGVLMLGGVSGLVVSTGCTSSECGYVFGGALGVAPLAGGSLLVSYLTAFRGQALHGLDRDKSLLGWLGAGIVTGGVALLGASLVGVDTQLEPLATGGLFLTAGGLPLVAAQGLRNAKTRRSGEKARVRIWIAPSPVQGAPGWVVAAVF